IVDPAIVDHYVVFGALCGATTWNLITWYYGIPSSSSHALVGGIIGAGVAKAGVGKLVAGGVLKTAAAIVVSPLFGFVLAITLMIVVSWIFARSTPRRVDRWFRRLQFVSAALYSLGHGGNDAQKTMGIIWMLLIASGLSAASEPLPFWVVLACQAGFGIPVSTTHTITGSIIGVGSARKLSAVRWGVAGNIIWAWVFTIPGSAFIAAVAWLLGTEYF
ncbi:MAG: inorganic phosphate transporter, partial [Betaproteobacteria bacterium]